MTRPPTYPIACAAAFALSTVLLPQPALAQQPWLNTSLSARFKRSW